MTTHSALDDFKAALSSVARAVTRDAEVEVGFTADAPAQIGKAIKVPTPSRTLPADQVAEARGFADSYALRMKHHSEKLHAAARPAEPLAAAAFDAMERARIEALGARHMDGMRANLSASLAMRMRSDPISRAQGRDDVPISSALELMLREALTGDHGPQGTEAGLSLVREWITKEAGGDLTALSMLLDDQAAFAETSKLALRHLDLIQSDEPLNEGGEDGGEEDESEAEDSQEEQDSEDGGAGESQVDARAEMAGDQADDGDSDSDAQEMEADGEPEMGGEGDEGMLPVRPNRLPGDIPDFNYLRFTEKHDEIILATELCDADELTRLRAYLDQQIAASAGRGDQARQPFATAFDGATEPGVGFRPGGRPARRRAAGPRHRLARPVAELQDRARYRFPRHRRHPADRQFGVDARAADQHRRDQRRYPRAHP